MNNLMTVFQLYAFLICCIVITRGNADSPLKNGDVRPKLTEKEIETIKMGLKKNLLRETGNEKSETNHVWKDPHRMFKYSPEEKGPQSVPETCNCTSLLQELSDCKNKTSNQFVSYDTNDINEKIVQEKDGNSDTNEKIVQQKDGNSDTNQKIFQQKNGISDTNEKIVQQKDESNGNSDTNGTTEKIVQPKGKNNENNDTNETNEKIVQQKDENNGNCGTTETKNENNTNNLSEAADFMYFRRLVMIMGNKLEHEGSATITIQLSSDDVATLRRATKKASKKLKDMLLGFEVLTKAAEKLSVGNAYSSNDESLNSISGIFTKSVVLGIIIVILCTIFMVYNLVKHSDYLVHISSWHIFWLFLIIVFIASVWNDYLYLYQMEVTAREHKIISGMPTHCLKQNQEGIFDKILNYVWPNANDQACLEYYQTVNVDPSVKVTLAKAVGKTLVTFIIAPVEIPFVFYKGFIIGLMTDYPFYIYIPVMIITSIIFVIYLFIVFEFIVSRIQAPIRSPFVTQVSRFKHYLFGQANSFQQHSIDTTRCQTTNDLLKHVTQICSNAVMQKNAHGPQQLGQNAIQAGPASAEKPVKCMNSSTVHEFLNNIQQVLREPLNSTPTSLTQQPRSSQTNRDFKRSQASETGQGNGEGSNGNNSQDDDTEQSNDNDVPANWTSESAKPIAHQGNEAETIDSEKLVDTTLADQSEGLQYTGEDQSKGLQSMVEDQSGNWQSTVEDQFENRQSTLDDKAEDCQCESASSLVPLPSDCTTSSDCETCANEATNI